MAVSQLAVASIHGVERRPRLGERCFLATHFLGRGRFKNRESRALAEVRESVQRPPFILNPAEAVFDGGGDDISAESFRGEAGGRLN
jgi:hypothetical protein